MDAVRCQRRRQALGIRPVQHDMRAAPAGRQRVGLAERAQEKRGKCVRLPAERRDIDARKHIERSVQRRERQRGGRRQGFRNRGEYSRLIDPGRRTGPAAEETAAPPDRRLDAGALQRGGQHAGGPGEVEDGERAGLARLRGKRGHIAEHTCRGIEAVHRQQRIPVQPDLWRLDLVGIQSLRAQAGQQGGELAGRGQHAAAAGRAGRGRQRFQRIGCRSGEAERFNRGAQQWRELSRRRLGKAAAIGEIGAPFDAEETVEPCLHAARQRPEPVAVEPEFAGRQLEPLAQIGERVGRVERQAVGPCRHGPPNSSSAARRAMPALSWPTPGAVCSSQAKGTGSRSAMSRPASKK